MGQLEIRKVIPADKLTAYFNNGWRKFRHINQTMIDDDPKFADSRFVFKMMDTGYELDEQVDLVTSRRGVLQTPDEVMREPYLIHRARICRPLGMCRNCKLSGAVYFDYMGSSEFEGRAMSLALRLIQSQFQFYKVHLVPELCAKVGDKTFGMRIFANFDNETQLIKYVDYINDIVNGKGNTLEPAYIGLNFDDTNKPDVWFDLDNGIIFSYDKQFMNRVASHLQLSFDYMDKK